MIVVASNGMAGVPPHPFEAGLGVEGVIHQIAQTEANVMGFGEGLERGPIAVDIGYNQNPHAYLPYLKNS
jgi:hypothetical protein